MEQEDLSQITGEKPPRRDWSVRRLMIVLAVVSVPLAWVVTPAARWFWNQTRFASEFQHLGDQIDALKDAPPQGFDPVAWEEARGWARNYLGNIVSFDRSIPPSSLRLLADEIEARIKAGQVDSRTFLWVYTRLASLNPYGAGYDRRFRAQGIAALVAGEFERHHPPGISAADWKQATRDTRAACIDVYYQSALDEEEKTPAEVAARFLEDLERTLEGPFTVEALSALWYRLAGFGTEAAVYVNERRPAVLRSTSPSHLE